LESDVANKDFDLVFAHLPCPHLPRVDGQNSKGIYNDYYDNLNHCDNIVSTTINTLRANDDRPWRLIVTSDHWFRPGDWIRNKKPGEPPPLPRMVPFYLLENGYNDTPVRIAEGSNIRLQQVISIINNRQINIDRVKAEILKHDIESVLLDRF
jgi:hypothetical protein